VGPKRLTGYVAAATILAASLLGIAWANSDKAQDKKNQQQAAATQPTTGQKPTQKATDQKTQPVTRTIGGATVAVDPATGRLVPPTPEEMAKLTAALYKMVSRESADDLLIIPQEDGSLMGVLDDSYNEVAMATRDAKGNLRLHCIDTPDQAKRVLEGKANVGPIYNEKKAKTTGKKAAQKPGPSFTETE
jgi:hypothetical protein